MEQKFTGESTKEITSNQEDSKLNNFFWNDKFGRMDIFYLFSFLLTAYFFNSFILALSVFAYRVVNTDSNLVPFVSVTYGIMLFMYLLNFYRFYSYLGNNYIKERLDLIKSSLGSLMFILILGIIADVIISRIPF